MCVGYKNDMFIGQTLKFDSCFIQTVTPKVKAELVQSSAQI